MSNPPRYKYEGFERAVLALLTMLVRRGHLEFEDRKLAEEIYRSITDPLNTRL